MVWANQPTGSHGRSCILLQIMYQFQPIRPCCEVSVLSCQFLMARSTTLSRNFAGISNLVPLRTSLPRMESSFLTALYCGRALSHSLVVMHSHNCEISGSSHDSSSTSCTDIAAGVDVSATNRINSSALSFMHTPFPLPRRDSRSAMFCLPGTYCTLNLYGCGPRTQRSI